MSVATLVSRFRPVLLALCLSCAGAPLEARLKVTESTLLKARESGAYLCMPKELALGEANADFTRHELDKGEYVRATEHLAIAETNARSALEGSPRERCTKREDADRDGDGIPDRLDKCPLEAEDVDGYMDQDGCPDPDNDNDEIPDRDDKCPNEPEDRDGFDDEDGCPDPDNDLDGIPDVKDKCPNEAEDRDGFEDEDGCPDPDNDKDGVPDENDKCPNEAGEPPDGCPKNKRVRLTGEKIEISDKIFFATGKAKVLPRSFGLLNEVADVIKQNPTLRIRVEGHTDSRGAKKKNTTLSQDRAEAVRLYLLGRGIPSERLESKGYGPDRPIASNKTNAGREQNRRVEFVRVERPGGGEPEQP